MWAGVGGGSQRFLSQVDGVSLVSPRVDSMSPGYDVMRKAFHLCGLPPQNPQPQSNRKENIGSALIEGYCTKHLTDIFKTVKVIKNKVSLRSRHRPEVARGHDD